MRILLWHGYLLGGTGSNVYTRALAREWSRAGHEVVVFSQDPSPEQYDLGGAQSVRPDIGRLLPVFVLDHYEGFDARRLPDLSAAEREQYVAANAAVLREHLPADLDRQAAAGVRARPLRGLRRAPLAGFVRGRTGAIRRGECSRAPRAPAGRY